MLPLLKLNRLELNAGSQSEPRATSPVREQRLNYDLSMDLALLRQLRAHPNPFVRGSESMDLTAKELSSEDPARFASLSKKGVRDRVKLLLDHHGKGDAWKKRQYVCFVLSRDVAHACLVVGIVLAVTF